MNDQPQPHLIESLQLRDLPSYAKLYVGLFTALMLAVCFWAVWIFYEEYGKPDEANLPAYLQSEQTAKPRDTIRVGDLPPDVRQDINTIWSDTAAVLAPEWDSAHAGREEKIDSNAVVAIAESALTVEQRERRRDSLSQQDDTGEDEEEDAFEENLKLAHTHINGQTLLFFAMGLLFLFTSVKPGMKKFVLWVFAACVLFHNVGLSGRGMGILYDDLLAVSGFLILALIVYMAYLIFIDLAKARRA